MLEWQIGEAENWDDFEPLEAILEIPVAPRRPAGRRPHMGLLLRALLLITVLAPAIVAYRLWRNYRENVAHIQTDIQGTIDLEAWAWQSSNRALADDLLDGQAPESWAYRFQRVQEWTRRWAGDESPTPVVEIQNMELRDDVALVEVIATQPGVPWATTPYRETRFYHKVDERWRRTAPAADFWGPQRTLETAHFRFVFHRRDAEAVAAVAGEIDELYAALRSDAGLIASPTPCETDMPRSTGEESTCEESDTAGKLLTIEVVPRTDVMYWRFTDERLTVPSPALMPVPVDLPDVIRLRQSILYPLARQVLDEALQQRRVQPQWQPVAYGLHLWLIWNDNSLPSAWRYHVEGLLQKRLKANTPLHLSDLLSSGAEKWWDREGRWLHTMAAGTVVEYIVATYGRERLPALVRGLGEHENWDTLIPAVFGVPVVEFEAGWHAHLAARYPVAFEPDSGGEAHE